MQHVEWSGLKRPKPANGSAVSVDCLVQRSLRELVISVYSNSHSFLLWFDLFGGRFCGIFFFVLRSVYCHVSFQVVLCPVWGMS